MNLAQKDLCIEWTTTNLDVQAGCKLRINFVAKQLSLSQSHEPTDELNLSWELPNLPI